MARREQENGGRYISDEWYGERQQKKRKLQEWQDFQNPGWQNVQRTANTAQPRKRNGQQPVNTAQPRRRNVQQPANTAQPVRRNVQQPVNTAQPVRRNVQRPVNTAQPGRQNPQRYAGTSQQNGQRGRQYDREKELKEWKSRDQLQRERQMQERQYREAVRRKEQKRRQRKTANVLRWIAVLTMCSICIVFLMVLRGMVRHDGRGTANRAGTSHYVQTGMTDTAEPAKSVADCSVMLDAGHGGKDCGTMYGSVQEKDLVLDIVLKMKEQLEKNHINVILTRQDDTFLELEDRIGKANQEGVDLFVSVHCNYYEDSGQIAGVECYYSNQSRTSCRYAETLMDYLGNTDIEIRSARDEDYYVLREASVPSILIETGYLSNDRDRKHLLDEEYRGKLAEEMVKGILEGLRRR